MRTRERNLKNFEDALIEHGGNQTRAYMSLHPEASPRTASANAIKLLDRNPQVMVNISQRMNDSKGDEAMLCAKLVKLVNCKKSIVVDKVIHRVSDNQTQLDSVKTALKLHGHLVTGVHISTDNRQVNIGESVLDHRQLKTLTQKLTLIHNKLAFTDEEQDGEVIDADFTSGDDASAITDEEALIEMGEGDEEVEMGGTGG